MSGMESEEAKWLKSQYKEAVTDVELADVDVAHVQLTCVSEF